MVVVGIAARAGAVSPLFVEAVTWLGVINLVVAVFNALPGAPLDGGRLLHAFVHEIHRRLGNQGPDDGGRIKRITRRQRL